MKATFSGTIDWFVPSGTNTGYSQVLVSGVQGAFSPSESFVKYELFGTAATGLNTNEPGDRVFLVITIKNTSAPGTLTIGGTSTTLLVPWTPNPLIPPSPVPLGTLYVVNRSSTPYPAELDFDPNIVSPDDSNSVTISSTSSVADGTLFSGTFFPYGWYARLVWVAGTLRARFYVKISDDTKSAMLHFEWGQIWPDSIKVVMVAAATDLFSNTDYVVIEVDVPYLERLDSQNHGTWGDGATNAHQFLTIWATTTSGTPITVTLGMGANCRTNINSSQIHLLSIFGEE